MDPDRYLMQIRADADRLLEAAARRVDGPLPTCPRWTDEPGAVARLRRRLALVTG